MAHGYELKGIMIDMWKVPGRQRCICQTACALWWWLVARPTDGGQGRVRPLLSCQCGVMQVSGETALKQLSHALSARPAWAFLTRPRAAPLIPCSISTDFDVHHVSKSYSFPILMSRLRPTKVNEWKILWSWVFFKGWKLKKMQISFHHSYINLNRTKSRVVSGTK
jgi:hypothetical protein